MSALFDYLLIELPLAILIDQHQAGFNALSFSASIFGYFENLTILHDKHIIWMNAALDRQSCVPDEHSILAMNRHEEFWFADVDHQFLLFTTGMTRDVHP